MPPAYHIGAQNIAIRLGYKSPRMVRKLIIKEGLPVYRRVIKIPTGTSRAFAISESALTAWELSKGRLCTQRVLADEETKRLQRLSAPKRV